MNRRNFIKQGAIISLLPLLPSIAMSQVRPTIDIRMSLYKLCVATSKAAKAMRDLGMSFDGAAEGINKFKEAIEFEDSELYEDGTIRTSGYGHTWRPLHIADDGIDYIGDEAIEV